MAGRPLASVTDIFVHCLRLRRPAIHLLPPERHSLCRVLLEPLRFQLTSHAVARGLYPGEVFIDDEDSPMCVFVVNAESIHIKEG